MKLFHEIPYELLAKKFSGETSLIEDREIAEWLACSDSHQAIYAEHEVLWQAARFDRLPSVSPRKQAVWNGICQHIGKQVPVYSRSFLIRVASIAAVVALIVGYSFSLYTHPPSIYQSQQFVVVTQGGQKSKIYLPDSTEVWLNSDTKLTYSSGFNQENREVQIDGEAYFSVQKSANHPFLVNVGEVGIKVYGTEFNVKAPRECNMVAVALVKGSVSLLSTVGMKELIKLCPDQMATVNRTELTTEVVPCNAVNESVWRYNKLFFDNTPIDEMWAKLEGWYGVQFIFQNEKPQISYRYALKTESLNELLILIDRLTPIEYTLNGEEVRIRYK